MKRSWKTFTGVLLTLLLVLPVLMFSLPNGSKVERNLSISGTLPGNSKDNPNEILKNKPKVKITPKPSTTPKVTVKPTASPKVTATPKPTASPKVTATPKPTATSTPTVAPSNPALFNPEGDYVKPTIVFEAPVCKIIGDKVEYYTTINFSNGNYYSYQEPWRGGKVFEITDGRSWSYTQYEVFRKDYIFPGSGRTVTFKNRILYLNAFSLGNDKIELPPVSNATCK